MAPKNKIAYFTIFFDAKQNLKILLIEHNAFQLSHVWVLKGLKTIPAVYLLSQSLNWFRGVNTMFAKWLSWTLSAHVNQLPRYTSNRISVSNYVLCNIVHRVLLLIGTHWAVTLCYIYIDIHVLNICNKYKYCYTKKILLTCTKNLWYTCCQINSFCLFWDTSIYKFGGQQLVLLISYMYFVYRLTVLIVSEIKNLSQTCIQFQKLTSLAPNNNSSNFSRYIPPISE